MLQPRLGGGILSSSESYQKEECWGFKLTESSINHHPHRTSTTFIWHDWTLVAGVCVCVCTHRIKNKYQTVRVAGFTVPMSTQISEMSHFTVLPITFQGNLCLARHECAHTQMTSRKEYTTCRMFPVQHTRIHYTCVNDIPAGSFLGSTYTPQTPLGALGRPVHGCHVGPRTAFIH